MGRASRSVYDVVFRHTTRIERLLEERGGEGNGIIGKAQRVRYALSVRAWQELEWISRERNRVAHEEDPYLEDPAEFERSARMVIAAIEAIPLDHDRNFTGWLRRSFNQRRGGRRSQLSPGAQLFAIVVAAIVASIILYQMRERERALDDRRRAFDERRGESGVGTFGWRDGVGYSTPTADSSNASKPKPKPKASTKRSRTAKPATADPAPNDTTGASSAAAESAPSKPSGTITMTPEELGSF